MTSGKIPKHEDASSGKASQARRTSEPEWADGLRQIYDSVLDEPLPDSFNELLAKLDDPAG